MPKKEKMILMTTKTETRHPLSAGKFSATPKKCVKDEVRNPSILLNKAKISMAQVRYTDHSLSGITEKISGSRPGLNPRPPFCQTDALPTGPRWLKDSTYLNGVIKWGFCRNWEKTLHKWWVSSLYTNTVVRANNSRILELVHRPTAKILQTSPGDKRMYKEHVRSNGSELRNTLWQNVAVM